MIDNVKYSSIPIIKLNVFAVLTFNKNNKYNIYKAHNDRMRHASYQQTISFGNILKGQVKRLIFQIELNPFGSSRAIWVSHKLIHECIP